MCVCVRAFMGWCVSVGCRVGGIAFLFCLLLLLCVCVRAFMSWCVSVGCRVGGTAFFFWCVCVSGCVFVYVFGGYVCECVRACI